MSTSHFKNSRLDHPNGLEPLRVVSFWDGRLGHEKQTRGVLAALAKLTAVAEVPRRVPPLSKAGRIRA